MFTKWQTISSNSRYARIAQYLGHWLISDPAKASVNIYTQRGKLDFNFPLEREWRFFTARTICDCDRIFPQPTSQEHRLAIA
ncbi:hypothetical protein [Pseudanabaena sp. UWO310]|uniref:hypothetical protein n=1 Tax=Pseudanabaena sp. UWO310 TaxID=2480795 RepID=UPI001161399D|nr:hypothetical protein [Pseudanabaena sp. UWO310]TYQ24144.1 hypothetical protein PseudUWO310_21185 [Pseudanabaena sp. UWO310]